MLVYGATRGERDVKLSFCTAHHWVTRSLTVYIKNRARNSAISTFSDEQKTFYIYVCLGLLLEEILTVSLVWMSILLQQL